MKRVLVAAMTLLVTGSVFATEGKIEKEKVKVEIKKDVKTVELKKVDEVDGECTVSFSGRIEIPGISGTFTCSSTESTCDAAIDKAISCIKSAIDRLKRRFLQ